MNKYSVRLLIVGVALLSATCGKKSNGAIPTTPTPTAQRASLALTVGNVSGSKTAAGYSYNFQVRWQETVGASATITSLVMTFSQGATVIGTIDGTSDIASKQVNANASSALNWTVTDDNAGHPFASSIRAVLTYSDSIGSQTASATATVPSLPDAPTTFGICGTVRDGGTPVSDIQITIVGTSLVATTDSQGHYCFAGISPGPITLQIVRSGYNTLQQTISVNGDMTVDLVLTRAGAPAVSIDNFSADSTLITRGQSTSLRWSVSNSTNVMIDNGIGSVSTSGATSVSPTALSTTYRLTAAGIGGPVSRSVTIVAADPNAMTCTVQVPTNVTAICNDGSYSMSQNNSGTCSSHSGVRCWVCPGPLCKQ
jgi:hypothetical protein